MANKDIHIYVDYDTWYFLKNKGINISEICNEALNKEYNRLAFSNGSLIKKVKDEISQKEVEVEKEIDEIKKQKETELENLKSKLLELQAKEEQQRIENEQKEYQAKRSMYIREALKLGIRGNKEIEDYIQSKTKKEVKDVLKNLKNDEQ